MFTKESLGWKDANVWVKENSVYARPTTLAAKSNGIWVSEKDKVDYALILGALDNKPSTLTMSVLGMKSTKIDVFLLDANNSETLVETWDFTEGSTFNRLPAASNASRFLFKFHKVDYGTTAMVDQQFIINSSSVTDVISFGTDYNCLLYPRLNTNAKGTLPFIDPHKNIRSLAYVFSRKGAPFHPSIADIDVSLITDFRYCFRSADEFTIDISKWNTANGTNMVGMFYGALKFNQDISLWNVDKVTTWNNFSADSSLETYKKPYKFR